MVALTTEISESLTGTKTVFLAKSSKNRVPNVVPIGAFKHLDGETLLISDQYFHKTMQNMAENPVVALSWWGEKGGFQIKGTAEYHDDGPVFRENQEWMAAKHPKFIPKGAVTVRIAEVYALKAGPDAGRKVL